MRTLALTFALLAPTALADVIVDPAAESIPEPGCYARTYDGAHLAAHPDQVVAAMRLNFVVADGSEGMNAAPGSVVAFLDVDLARQGHVVRGPFTEDAFPEGFGSATMYAALLCPGQGITCGSECMGETLHTGFAVIGDDGKTLKITTRSLPVGQGQDCGGYTDIAEVQGELTTFVLDRVADAVCEQD
jgi:hypothetical protein